MSENGDLISVVVPVYNAEKYIDKCVDSILNQSYKNLELILVDDGSSDLSLKKCEAKKECDSRIVLISQKNSGVTKARSVGVENATGKWVCFVDSDDVLPVDSIRCLYMNSESADIVVGQIHYNGTYEWKYPIFKACLSSFDAIEAMFHERIHSGPVARLIKRDLFDAQVLDIPRSITHGEDFIMNYRLFQKTESIKVIDCFVYEYVENLQGSSNNNDPYRSLKYCRLQEKILNESTLFCNKKRMKPLLREFYWLHRKGFLKKWIKIFVKKIFNQI